MESKFIEYLKSFYDDKHQLSVITRIAKIHDDYKNLSDDSGKGIVECYIGANSGQFNPIYLKAFYYDIEQLIRCLKELFSVFGRELDESEYLDRGDKDKYKLFDLNYTKGDDGNQFKNYIVIFGCKVYATDVYSIVMKNKLGSHLDEHYIKTVAINIAQLSKARNEVSHKTYEKGYENRMLDLIELGYKAYSVFINHRELIKKLIMIYEQQQSNSNKGVSKLKKVNSF